MNRWPITKTLFQQQLTEYDCVPASFMNALRFLFGRQEIPQLVIKQIYLFTLDRKAGTSRKAIEHLDEWINSGVWKRSGQHKQFRLSSKYLRGKHVNLRNGDIRKSLSSGTKSVVLFRVTHSGQRYHYVLALFKSRGWVYMYDSYGGSRRKLQAYEFGHYYPDKKTQRSKTDRKQFTLQIKESVQMCNLKVHEKWIGRKSDRERFHLGPVSERECLILNRK